MVDSRESDKFDLGVKGLTKYVVVSLLDVVALLFGDSCTCLIIFKAPATAPGNFKVSSSSSLSLDISWDAIPAKERNGELLGYFIYYKVNGSAVEYNKTVGPDKLSDKLTELEFTTYVVRMAGYTVAGVGLSTKAVSIQPNEGGRELFFTTFCEQRLAGKCYDCYNFCFLLFETSLIFQIYFLTNNNNNKHFDMNMNIHNLYMSSIVLVLNCYFSLNTCSIQIRLLK